MERQRNAGSGKKTTQVPKGRLNHSPFRFTLSLPNPKARGCRLRHRAQECRRHGMKIARHGAAAECRVRQKNDTSPEGTAESFSIQIHPIASKSEGTWLPFAPPRPRVPKARHENSPAWSGSGMPGQAKKRHKSRRDG